MSSKVSYFAPEGDISTLEERVNTLENNLSSLVTTLTYYNRYIGINSLNLDSSTTITINANSIKTFYLDGNNSFPTSDWDVIGVVNIDLGSSHLSLLGAYPVGNYRAQIRVYNPTSSPVQVPDGCSADLILKKNKIEFNDN